jgi:hypothetical protein
MIVFTKKMLTVLLLLTGCLPALATPGIEDQPSAYVIESVSPDSSLAENEALIVFTCKENRKKQVMANQEIIYSFAAKNVTDKTDAAGVFKVKVKPGKYFFTIAAGTIYVEILIPNLLVKKQTRTNITLSFADEIFIQPMKKPVIYLYPEGETEVNVKLDVKGGLDFTYPAYNNGWSFGASPNGDLHFGAKTYSYLFWEGMAKMDAADMNSNAGFVVSKDSLVDFFETKLAAMGLTFRERSDFIAYWCPQMNKHKNCFVHFLFKEELEKYASLSIDPAPDELFRVFMLWKPIENGKEMVKIAEQKLPSVKREGFTAIEWGGTEIIQIRP